MSDIDYNISRYNIEELVEIDDNDLDIYYDCLKNKYGAAKLRFPEWPASKKIFFY